MGNEGLVRQGQCGVGGGGGGGGNVNMVGGNGVGNSVGVVSSINTRGVSNSDGSTTGSGGTILFVGDLHWRTTYVELETELSMYEPMKKMKFFNEKSRRKSKGYCQVEFFYPSVATACKEGMNEHVFSF